MRGKCLQGLGLADLAAVDYSHALALAGTPTAPNTPPRDLGPCATMPDNAIVARGVCHDMMRVDLGESCGLNVSPHPAQCASGRAAAALTTDAFMAGNAVQPKSFNSVAKPMLAFTAKRGAKGTMS